MHSTDRDRRTLLQLLACTMPQTSIGLGALAAMGNVAAQTATDAKFLICLYMRGGNDQSNLLIPTSTAEYAAYRNGRPSICLERTAPIALQPDGFAGPTLGLHPSLPFLAQLFNQGQAAFLANVGNLVVPTSQAQWNKGAPSVPVPVQLFSHSDQESQWYTGSPSTPSKTGWLGRTADLLMDTYNPNNPVSMCLALGRATFMLAGQRAIPYKLSPFGSTKIYPYSNGIQYSGVAGATLRSLYQQPSRTNLMERTASTIVNRSASAEALVTSALNGVSMSTTFPTTPLGQQLFGVARMMAASATLNQKRQVFFVDIDGFDFHDDLVARQANRLSEINNAIQAFYNFLQTSGLWSKAVVFSASDFGRALQSNGKGADHGWGSHHFAFGGPVKGKRVYGQWPTVALLGKEDAGQGRLIPTTSLDQYAGTLATWFGVSDTDLPKVMPNIGNFSARNLGFLG